MLLSNRYLLEIWAQGTCDLLTGFLWESGFEDL